MTTDREVLVELLNEVDDLIRAQDPDYDGALADAADRAHAHLARPTEDPCSVEVTRASAAAYAAGQARNAGAAP